MLAGYGHIRFPLSPVAKNTRQRDDQRKIQANPAKTKLMHGRRWVGTITADIVCDVMTVAKRPANRLGLRGFRVQFGSVSERDERQVMMVR